MKHEAPTVERTSPGVPPATHAIAGSRLWHLITSEYPPQLGGVSDYTRLVAEQLAASGDEVHVWAPPTEASPNSPGVTVHHMLGRAGVADLWRMGKELNRFKGPRFLLVQWVPHGYGFRAMNLPFCLWLWMRAAWRGDRVEIMVHEPCLSFGEGSWRQDAVAVVHRVMTFVLLRAASKVWLSIPAWEQYWRPYTMGRKTPFQCLAVPSNIAVCPETSGVQAVRERYLGGRRFLIGHFGTHGAATNELLEQILPSLLDRSPQAVILLMGKGSQEFRDKLRSSVPHLAERIHSGGILAPGSVSNCLAACDLLLQPYPDGLSARRTSAMAALSHGLPLVTTSGRFTEDFWRESNAVVAAPAGDAAAFVDAAERLLSDDQERNRLGSRARKLYDERFDIKHVITALRCRLTTEE